MNKNLEELIEISGYLGDIDSSALLHTMSQTLLAGNYTIDPKAVIGITTDVNPRCFFR